MLVVFLLFFVAAPILELYVGSLVVDAIGFGPATLLLLARSALGVARHAGSVASGDRRNSRQRDC